MSDDGMHILELPFRQQKPSLWGSPRECTLDLCILAVAFLIIASTVVNITVNMVLLTYHDFFC